MRRVGLAPGLPSPPAHLGYYKSRNTVVTERLNSGFLPPNTYCLPWLSDLKVVRGITQVLRGWPHLHVSHSR